MAGLVEEAFLKIAYLVKQYKYRKQTKTGSGDIWKFVWLKRGKCNASKYFSRSYHLMPQVCQKSSSSRKFFNCPMQEEKLREEAARRMERRRRKMLSPEERLAK